MGSPPRGKTGKCEATGNQSPRGTPYSTKDRQGPGNAWVRKPGVGTGGRRMIERTSHKRKLNRQCAKRNAS
ncbi:MAG: hypothetical protein LBF22_00820 [Deltaproteobacteria bacterium]|nr:hypothetical protein [Deltaproteobacteria bacterium]